jgi:hypothetical protein
MQSRRRRASRRQEGWHKDGVRVSERGDARRRACDGQMRVGAPGSPLDDWLTLSAIVYESAGLLSSSTGATEFCRHSSMPPHTVLRAARVFRRPRRRAPPGIVLGRSGPVNGNDINGPTQDRVWWWEPMG